MSTGATVPVQVVRIDQISRAVRLFELRSVSGDPLPGVEPGAHVAVHTPAGHVRSYSITERSTEGGYVIAVARDGSGRGGSVSMHDDLALGDVIQISAPANAFRLIGAESYLLIAGGIGITPIRAMFHALAGHSRVRMLYLGRTPEETVYAEELVGRDGVAVHYSSPHGRFDLWSVLGTVDEQTHIYCCAGPALTEQVRLLTMHWRPSHVHFENFAGVSTTGATARPFHARWQPLDQVVPVSADESLLSALRRNGISVDSSCESGTCGTCVLRLVDGAVEHRDLVLTESERGSRIISCVSRAENGQITVAL